MQFLHFGRKSSYTTPEIFGSMSEKFQGNVFAKQDISSKGSYGHVEWFWKSAEKTSRKRSKFFSSRSEFDEKVDFTFFLKNKTFLKLVQLTRRMH